MKCKRKRGNTLLHNLYLLFIMKKLFIKRAFPLHPFLFTFSMQQFPFRQQTTVTFFDTFHVSKMLALYMVPCRLRAICNRAVLKWWHLSSENVQQPT